MRVIVGSKITIEDCPSSLSHKLDRMLSFDNPEYEKKQRMGLWCGNTPKKLSMLERRGKDVIVPYGILKQLQQMPECKDAEISHKKHSLDCSFEYGSCFKPYAYQEKAIWAAQKAGQGVIIAPCGSGKTNIGLELCARLGYTALWLTHTGDLLEQSINRAKSLFDMPESAYGTITAGKVNLGSVITFATVQTMSKIDLSSIKDYFGVVVVDECHRIAGTPTKISMFYKVLSGLNAPYKYGLTATPYRSDGLIGCMFCLLGDACYTIDKCETASTTCDIFYHVKSLPFHANVDDITQVDGTLSWSKLVNALCADEARTREIVQDVKKCMKANKACLLLTDRVEHAKEIAKMLGNDAVALVGSVSKSKRAHILAELNTGVIKCVCATYQLAKEGLDVPNLEYVFFATPQKNKSTVEQSAGRVGRAAEGKKCGYVIDYVDSFGMLIHWHKLRKRVYKKIGAKEKI